MDCVALAPDDICRHNRIMGELETATVVDSRYEILSPLGHGGFGIVYRATQLSFDRQVALKVLPPSESLDQEVLDRFKREATVLSSLKHRNLALFYGYGIWHSCPYIAMELIEGCSLQEYLDRRGKLADREAITIIKQVCEALACAHSHGIVHRDVKPSNIILCRQQSSQVKLIDFGLAKVSATADGESMQKLTRAGFTVGSFLYMSPEQCRGKAVDALSDIYALGCILHKCLTGVGPFKLTDDASALQKHLYEVPSLLSEHLEPGSYATNLQLVLNKALAKIPEERYQRVDEMLSDLGAVYADEKALYAAGAKVPASLSTPIRALPVQKKPNYVMWGAGIGLAATLAIAVSSGAFGPSNHTNADRLSVDYWNQARILYDYDGADSRAKYIELLQKSLRANDKDHLLTQAQIPLIDIKIVRAYVTGNDLPGATATCKHGIRALIHIGRYDEQIQELATTLANASIQLHRETEAIDCLKQALKAAPAKTANRAFDVLRLRLAQLYVAKQDPTKAVAFVNALDPSFVDHDEEFTTEVQRLKRALQAVTGPGHSPEGKTL